MSTVPCNMYSCNRIGAQQQAAGQYSGNDSTMQHGSSACKTCAPAASRAGLKGGWCCRQVAQWGGPGAPDWWQMRGAGAAGRQGCHHAGAEMERSCCVQDHSLMWMALGCTYGSWLHDVGSHKLLVAAAGEQ